MAPAPTSLFIPLPDPSDAGKIRRIHVLDWQPERAAKETLVCMHGLTRNARDFDYLAAELVTHGYRVIAASMAGRGESDPFTRADNYVITSYVADCLSLLGQFGLTSCSWLGTSMGGMIGMALAAMPESPVQRLILNDIGMIIPAEGLNRIAQYVGQSPLFASREEGEAYLREVALKSFGIREEEHWAHMVEISLRPAGNGYEMAYDPQIGNVFRALANEDGKFTEPLDMTAAWQLVQCPALLLYGKMSDLMNEATCQTMAKNRNNVQYHGFADTGHAPTLMDAEQIGIVCRWLEQTGSGQKEAA